MERQDSIWQVPRDGAQWRQRVELAAPLGVFLVSVAIGDIAALEFGEGYASLFFVLGISIIGAISGLSVALVSALAAAVVFNFFVAAPDYQFRFTEPSDFAPPIVFLLSAMLSGWLSGRLKDQVVLAKGAAARLEYLLAASRSLQGASTGAEILAALRGSSLASSGIAFDLFMGEGGEVVPVIDPQWPVPPAMQEADVARIVLAQQLEVTRIGTLHGYGLRSGDRKIAALIVRVPGGLRLEDNFMLPLARIVALAIERAHLARQVLDARTAAQAEEFKSSLLASVSHDLRTPLTAIRTAASTLQSFGTTFDDSTRGELLGGIVGECDRLDHLTANLLEMSRLEGGRDSLRPTTLAAAETAHAVAARLDGEGRIAVDAPGAEILVAVDPVLFELALTNVVQNALRYSPAGSPVAIRCRVDGSDCTIAVTDEGPGIAEHDQARVFRRFDRGSARAAAPKGSGLGLAIAKGFVEASHGSIGVISPVAGGHGTTILLRLPLADRLRDAGAQAA